MEKTNKKLEESKNSETIRLKNIIDSLTLQKTNVEKKVMELNDKIEVLMKNEKIIKNKLKNNEENYKKCKKEKDELLENNLNIIKKSINIKWDLLTEKIISSNYKKKIDSLSSLIFETNDVVFQHFKIDQELQNKVKDLEEQLSQCKIELDKSKVYNRLLNINNHASEINYKSIELKFEKEKEELHTQLQKQKFLTKSLEKEIWVLRTTIRIGSGQEKEKRARLAKDFEEKQSGLIKELYEEKEKRVLLAKELNEEKEKTEKLAKELYEEKEKTQKLTKDLAEANSKITRLETEAKDFKDQMDQMPNLIQKKVLEILAANKSKEDGNSP